MLRWGYAACTRYEAMCCYDSSLVVLFEEHLLKTWNLATKNPSSDCNSRFEITDRSFNVMVRRHLLILHHHCSMWHISWVHLNMREITFPHLSHSCCQFCVKWNEFEFFSLNNVLGNIDNWSSDQHYNTRREKISNSIKKNNKSLPWVPFDFLNLFWNLLKSLVECSLV